jgi:hypothetical protein
MSDWKRYFGLDAFDTMVHGVITFGLMAVAAEAAREPGPALLVGCVGLVVFAVRRRLALVAMQRRGEISGEVSGASRALDTEGRLAELEMLYGRVAELEERLDFAERLLAAKHEPARLEVPRS